MFTGYSMLKQTENASECAFLRSMGKISHLKSGSFARFYEQMMHFLSTNKPFFLCDRLHAAVGPRVHITSSTAQSSEDEEDTKIKKKSDRTDDHACADELFETSTWHAVTSLFRLYRRTYFVLPPHFAVYLFHKVTVISLSKNFWSRYTTAVLFVISCLLNVAKIHRSSSGRSRSSSSSGSIHYSPPLGKAAGLCGLIPFFLFFLPSLFDTCLIFNFLKETSARQLIEQLRWRSQLDTANSQIHR